MMKKTGINSARYYTGLHYIKRVCQIDRKIKHLDSAIYESFTVIAISFLLSGSGRKTRVFSPDWLHSHSVLFLSRGKINELDHVTSPKKYFDRGAMTCWPDVADGGPTSNQHWIKLMFSMNKRDVEQWLERGVLLSAVLFRTPFGAGFSDKYHVSPLSILRHCFDVGSLET